MVTATYALENKMAQCELRMCALSLLPAICFADGSCKVLYQRVIFVPICQSMISDFRLRGTSGRAEALAVFSEIGAVCLSVVDIRLNDRRGGID